jgi:hypothetical protein
MKLKFSDNNKIDDFKTVDLEHMVYFGFEGRPTINAFSQKFQGTRYNSTTQMLLNNIDRLKLANTKIAAFVLHTVQDSVTLDIATAAYAATRTKEELSQFIWTYLSAYINDIEKGVTKPPFLKSLYAFYYSTSVLAKKTYPGPDQINLANQYLLEQYWMTLEATLNPNKIKSPLSFFQFMELIPENMDVSFQKEEIQNETHRYFHHDVSRAESFEIELPLKSPTLQTKYTRINLIAISDPRTKLLKFFTRNPMVYPDGNKRFYSCLYVHNPHKKGKAHEHIISTLPSDDFNLIGLTNLLEEIEDEARKQKGLAKRPIKNPREGYQYNDPWYDERHTNYSIIDTPNDGSCLNRNDILEALWYYGAPLKMMRPAHVTTSVFIPLWAPEKFKGIIESTSANWHKVVPDVEVLKSFFPFVEKIFSADRNPKNSFQSTLLSSEYQENIVLTLEPDFGSYSSPAISVIQGKALEKSIEILKKSKIILQFHQYEYNFGFFEIIINPCKGHCSIFDTQWLEQCISLTPFTKLFEQILVDWNTAYADSDLTLAKSLAEKLEMPNKHFVCSTLSDFNYEGSYLQDGRSTGGCLQMMVCDENPFYKNLPLETKIVTDQTIVDKTSKRHYFCSSSSLLNYNAVANQNEHNKAHEISRIVFNMVLAQRFFLSKSRLDIVRSERDYFEKRKWTLWHWIKHSLSGKDHPRFDVDISELRADIQHMTTSSWFNVISNNKAIQSLFSKIRVEMLIDQFYAEVRERCVDLDEYIKKKESTKQSRIFGFLAFFISPLSLIVGFTGGLEFNTWEKQQRNAFSFFKDYFPDLIKYFPGFGDAGYYNGGIGFVLLFYTFILFVGIGLVWLFLKWLNLRE